MSWNRVFLLASCLTFPVAHEAVGEHCFWSGTSPFCDGSCPRGYEELKRDDRGDGLACLIGSKAFCCQACDWFGSVPLCIGTCPYGYELSETSNANCWIGERVRCCPEKSVSFESRRSVKNHTSVNPSPVLWI